ncbi:hypothetical protein [Desulfocurvibacter africanus]|uniref:hypothetical protein n=1 Tax=Desulfocurvibacter africanus TaxID=873 RepID=UPI0012B56D56|nr:hypothetical protein [Desulfocurvibacter africanus]
MNGSAPFEFQGHLEHFAFENAPQTMRRHGVPPRRRRRNSLAPSTPERASLKQSALFE